jgi:hypothetical protein
MTSTIIVGEDEQPGDVAAKLLGLADRQQDVQVRTDLARPAFDVPDELYKRYAGRGKRSDDERRVNQQAQQQADADAPEQLNGDELPDTARVVEPGDGDDLSEIVDDGLPDSAKVVEPPSNGDAPDDGTGNDEQGDEPDPEPEPEAPKPRKRASRAKATKSTAPAASGSGE